MPKLDGISVTRLLKSDPRTQGTPIIILTAYPHESIESGRAGGRCRYRSDESRAYPNISKPASENCWRDTGQLAAADEVSPRRCRARIATLSAADPRATERAQLLQRSATLSGRTSTTIVAWLTSSAAR